MSTKMALRVILLLVVTGVRVRAVLYDFSGGETHGVTHCRGTWNFRDASLYPGGPTTGSVYASSSSSACLSLPGRYPVTLNSVFNIYAYTNYTVAGQYISVTADFNVWFTVNGNQISTPWNQYNRKALSNLVGNRQVELSAIQPSGVQIAIRWIEITEGPLPTTTSSSTSTTELTTTTEVTTSTPEVTTSTPEVTTSTPEVTTSTPEVTSTTPESTTTELSSTSTEVTTELTSSTEVTTTTVPTVPSSSTSPPPTEPTSSTVTSPPTDSSTLSITNSDTSTLSTSNSDPSTLSTTNSDTSTLSTSNSDPSTLSITNSDTSTLSMVNSDTSTTTVPSDPVTPSIQPPLKWSLDDWSVVIGVAIGVLIAVATCGLCSLFWLLGACRTPRMLLGPPTSKLPAAPGQGVGLPRLEVVSGAPRDSAGSGSSSYITGAGSRNTAHHNWILVDSKKIP